VTSLLRTFHDVFPATTVWSGPRGTGYFFVGCHEDQVPWERFQRKIGPLFQNEAILRDLAEHDLTCVTREQLERLLLWREDQVGDVARDGTLITDDHPYTEFPLWRYLFGDSERWRPQLALLKP
jgi:hypothetical protein